MNVRVANADLADPRHVKGLLEVLDSYASDPAGGGHALPAEALNRLPAVLREFPTALVLLAFDDDQPVGAAVCFLGLSTFRAEPLLNIHDLAVLPRYRGRGIGRALLAAAEEQARRRGCCRLTLEVQDDNTRARALYRSFGFEDFVVAKPTPTRFLAKELSMKTITHTGGCHCGRVRFEVVAPARIEVTDCNCSICSKSGYLHLIVPQQRFKLLSGAESLTTYEFNTRTAKHLFCAVCGIKAFYVPRSHPDGYSVNARCLDDGTVEHMTITRADGKNWEKTYATRRAQPLE